MSAISVLDLLKSSRDLTKRNQNKPDHIPYLIQSSKTSLRERDIKRDESHGGIEWERVLRA